MFFFFALELRKIWPFACFSYACFSYPAPTSCQPTGLTGAFSLSAEERESPERTPKASLTDPPPPPPGAPESPKHLDSATASPRCSPDPGREPHTALDPAPFHQHEASAPCRVCTVDPYSSIPAWRSTHGFEASHPQTSRAGRARGPSLLASPRADRPSARRRRRASPRRLHACP